MFLLAKAFRSTETQVSEKAYRNRNDEFLDKVPGQVPGQGGALGMKLSFSSYCASTTVKASEIWPMIITSGTSHRNYLH
jgi:hypothetical protein